MEPEFDDELLQLKNALRQETFRFILVSRNRYSIYQDIAHWLRTTFPERHFLELRLIDKDYRQINDEIAAFKKGIILIPDFSWLFRDENEAICVAFNQRRDAFARLDIALICFIGPDEFIEIPKKVPDWWSLRSLELDFHREAADASGELLSSESESSLLGGRTKEEKEAEIQRLLRQIDVTDSSNKSLLFSLYSQIASLLFELSLFEEALVYLEQSLLIGQQIGNKQGEGAILNNISQIYAARGDYETALTYLEQSLLISQQTGNKQGEGTILNNISQIYDARGDFEKALSYLERSLPIRRQISDKRGEGTTLNNISQIYDARGNYETALTYLERSLLIRQQIGDKRGEGITSSNIGTLYWKQYQDAKKAIPLLRRALDIFTQIGSSDSQSSEVYLNTIREEVGEENYNKIIQSIPDELPS